MHSSRLSNAKSNHQPSRDGFSTISDHFLFCLLLCSVENLVKKARDLIEIWRRFSDENITNQMYDVALQALESDDVLVRNGDLIRINSQ